MNFIIPDLNPEQQRAATAPAGPLLIVAGAGTGKTRTLTSRIVHLIASGTPPERICAITFTNKAAQEMKERVSTLLGKGVGTPYLGTFHSLGARILRRECGAFGREPNFIIFDDHDSSDLVKKSLKTALQKPSKKETPAYFGKKITELKNLPAEKAFAGMNEEEKLAVHKVCEAYEAALQRNNAFDFDDLIEKPVRLFKKNIEALKRYQNRFDAILVDEYQDINPKQYELVRLLASGHRNLTVVGDDEQTIYTWRYADIKIFLDFDKDWPEASVYFLEENYRSTGNIIGGASGMVANNKFRTPKKLWTRENGGEAITLYEAWGENDEAAWIGNKISDLRGAAERGGEAPSNQSSAQTTSSSIAILYRTNAQSRAVEQALIREGIPYKIFGGLKFYERREVKDAVAALRYASNQRDELSRERLEKNLSKKKFAEFRMAIFAGVGSDRSADDAGQGAAILTPTAIIKIFLETFSYFEYLENNFINAEERQENIAELINFASGFENLPDFLERLSLLQATDDENAAAKNEGLAGAGPHHGSRGQSALEFKKTPPPVHLSTIHMAKGLEFDAVFLAGAAEGLLPHIRSIESEPALEEERRLMYVAMTRARKKLFVSFYGLPSRFVGEIPDEYTHFETAGDQTVLHRERRDYDDEVEDRENYVEF